MVSYFYECMTDSKIKPLIFSKFGIVNRAVRFFFCLSEKIGKACVCSSVKDTKKKRASREQRSNCLIRTFPPETKTKTKAGVLLPFGTPK